MATQFAFMTVEGMFPAGYGLTAVTETITSSASNQATTADSNAHNVCRVATDTDVYVSFGTAPDATSDSNRFLMPANSVEYFRVALDTKGAVVNA